MRNKILLYLFIFSVLFTIFIYVNDKRILDSLQEDKANRELKIQELETENEILKSENDNLRYFSLKENDDAITYFENMGVNSDEVIAKIEDELISRNLAEKDNELVPYDGMEGLMRINKINVLNHKWIIADFTDGTYWGEVFFSYEVDEEGQINFTREKSFLYPLN
ncbi:MAG: hypothetical protein RI572_01995 [Salegentibacter sp.]|uniref:hypothetical protein n=1 Tax=Salegentibacter sp. TaxID=1903072 RepID=UPI00286FDE26|nr:hypothetical protein [Salegentibacter sp.]MDR9456156.1 hypothetical protein [Salegentibacter sp.]